MTDRVEWVQFMNFDFLERIPLREALRHKLSIPRMPPVLLRRVCQSIAIIC
jgi:hypothetical protein